MKYRVMLLSLCLTLLPTFCINAANKLNMSYLYFGSPSTYVSQIDATHQTLNLVSPNYFDIVENGEVVTTWKLDQRFIAEMHARGVRVVPFLSNHWNRANGIAALAEEQQARIISNLVNLISQYELDGVNVDIEGVGSAYREAFTTFIQKLRAALPRDKEVSVAVAANPNGWTTGWHGFYDYVQLAKSSDYLMIMAYDESWQGGPAGPVASLSFFERSLTYALNLGVAREKIVMGLPFYGRLWKTAGANLVEENVNGLGVSHVRVAGFLQQYSATITYDEAKQSPYATFSIPAGSSAYLSGTTCTEGEYVLWFDDERSIKRKLRLLNEYGVKGAGSWSLNQEAVGTWSYFSRWLNGTFYRDVASGWWAESAIMQMAERGWMSGVSSTQFQPGGQLSRAQAAMVFTRVLQQKNVQVTSVSTPFTDIDSHWAEDAIAYAYQVGLVQGVDATHFKPNATLTRAEMAVILARLDALLKQATQSQAGSQSQP